MYIRTTLFKCFTVSFYFKIIYFINYSNIVFLFFFKQKWKISTAVNEKAKKAFVTKAKTSLTNTVLDWNDLWEFKGYGVKPNFLMNEAWVSNSN